jgi:hypothetical protein
MNIWKTQLVIAFIVSFLQWSLLFINYNLTFSLNFIVLPQAIGWTLWALFCFYKFKKNQ